MTSKRTLWDQWLSGQLCCHDSQMKICWHITQLNSCTCLSSAWWTEVTLQRLGRWSCFYSLNAVMPGTHTWNVCLRRESDGIKMSFFGNARGATLGAFRGFLGFISNVQSITTSSSLHWETKSNDLLELVLVLLAKTWDKEMRIKNMSVLLRCLLWSLGERWD